MLRYGYDELGQLVREDNRYTGKSYTWKYDNAGNILNRKTYAYTIDALGTAQNTVIYGYDTGNWGDLLISFNGQSIAYDGIGNPGTWNGSALTWQGRRLMSYGSNTYTYNADGIRTSKTVNGVKHIYHLAGTQILDEEWTEGNTRHLMVYVYDASGQPIGISHYTYNGTIVSENYYLLVSNIQGDIIGIYDSNGTRVVTYVYDAWGRILSTTGTGANTIGVYNPFRYRGYYYDTETSLYYLNSRYYDPNVGRFLNADGYINANGDLLGFNMFAYCGNNPVCNCDCRGTCPHRPNYLGDCIDCMAGIDTSNNDDSCIIMPEAPKRRNPFECHDGTFALYDNIRNNRKRVFHEQFLVLDKVSGDINLGEACVSIGGSASLLTGGWEFKNVDISLLDFGRIYGGISASSYYFNAEIGVSVWSPSVSFNTGYGHISIGVNLGVVWGVSWGQSYKINLGVFSASYDPFD